MTIKETVGYFINHNGIKLLTRRWVPSDPKALMVISHGFGEHSGRYGFFVEHFTKKGYAVAAFDHPGHGESEGRRGDVKTFDDWHQDLHDFVHEMHAVFPKELSIIVIGHSMGGMIALECAVKCKPDVAGFVISSPALKISVPRWKISLGKALPYLCPLCRVPTGIAPQSISRIESVVDDYATDPRIIHKLTARTWRAMMAYLEKVRDLSGKMCGHIMIFQERDDPVCDARATEDFYRRMPETNKKLILYDGAYHEPFNDEIREQVFADIDRWLDGLLG